MNKKTKKLNVYAKNFRDTIDQKDMLELTKLTDFLADKSITKVNMSTSYATDIDVPAFRVDKYIVWGATAMMMSELKEVIKNVLD